LLLLTLGLLTLVEGRRLWKERVALSSLPAMSAQPPNVLLIILDTVRAASLSLYGYSRPTTPHLERLAQGGVWFRHAFSPTSWTLPSHASIFTGRHAHELSTDWRIALDATYPTLAEVLSSRGYVTAGFVANTRYCNAGTGLSRGFIHYDDSSLGPGRLVESSWILSMIHRALERPTEYRSWVWRKHARDINRHFLRWVDRSGPRPFFAFLNYWDAHNPYAPPEGYADRFGTAGIPLQPVLEHRSDRGIRDSAETQGGLDAYDGAIAYLDAQLGALFGELRRRGLWDNLIIIVASDHGEEFDEHGLAQHGVSLYRPSVEVPFIIRAPRRVPEGVVVDVPVSLRDIPATIMDLLNLDNPSLAGRSAARFWTSASTPADTVVSSLTHAPGHPPWFPVSKGDMTSVTLGDLRYILNGDGSEELYDFAHDVAEGDNLAADSARTEDVLRFRDIVSALR
jgi:arylsulfatase A-like enzyme